MYTFVTSFHKKHFEAYGESMLRSVAEQWNPNDLRLIVYVEGYEEEEELPLQGFSSLIEYRHIEEIESRNAFISRHPDKNGIINNTYNYKFDAVRFCNKVFAYSEVAIELIHDDYKDWLFWIDADTITISKFNKEAVDKIIQDSTKEVVHLGRTSIDYSETGFIGWNLAYNNACSFIVDIRGAYEIDEVFGYREWHDAFIFERLLNIYKAHGMSIVNLSEGVDGLAVFENSILKDYFIHNKGNLKFNTPQPQGVSKDVTGPRRYKQLADIIRFYAKDKDSFSVVETGTWNGGRAIEMALAAFETVDKFTYCGFDLFEQATDETDRVELNIKQHNTAYAVEERLRQFAEKMAEKGKDFSFSLYAGDTKETMSGHSFDSVDLAYIDGGHSYDTAKSDYTYLENIPVVVFDDFYHFEDKEKLKDEYLGVINTVKEIKDKAVKVLPSQDKTALGGTVHLAVVLHKDIPLLPAELTNIPIVVRPKDCMPRDYIQNNITTNVPLIKNFDWVQHYRTNDKHVLVVSGGDLDFKKIKSVKNKYKAEVWCVKHSYPRLLENGIVPDYCVILDPRPLDGISTHGVKRKDLFETINNHTTFLIASMTDPSVVLHIMSKTNKVYGFHAYTDAIRDTGDNTKVTVDKTLPIPEGSLLISGGTAAATRTIGLLETLGFKNIHMFGFDCSIKNITDEMKQTKDEEGRDMYIHVTTGGEKFYTTGELLALAQDLEKMFEKKDLGLNIQFYGRGSLASQVFKQSYYNTQFKHFDKTVWQKN